MKFTLDVILHQGLRLPGHSSSCYAGTVLGLEVRGEEFLMSTPVEFWPTPTVDNPWVAIPWFFLTEKRYREGPEKAGVVTADR